MKKPGKMAPMTGFLLKQRGMFLVSDAVKMYLVFISTDSSRVSFEAADRPNYFLYASPKGQMRLSKWEDSKTFWDRATFILHRNTWVPGFDSLESHAKPGFFLYAMLPRLHLLKHRHTDSFRKAALFKFTGK